MLQTSRCMLGWQRANENVQDVNKTDVKKRKGTKQDVYYNFITVLGESMIHVQLLQTDTLLVKKQHIIEKNSCFSENIANLFFLCVTSR